MKICFVSSLLSIHAQRFIDKFKEKGYESHIVTFGGDNKIEDSDTTKFYNFDLERGGLFYWLRKNIKRYTSLKNLVHRVKPDILHAGWVQSDGFFSALTGYHPFLLMPQGS